MSGSFQIHTPASEFQTSTLGRFGRMLSTDVLTPSAANVLTYNNGMWEAVASGMGMPMMSSINRGMSSNRGTSSINEETSSNNEEYSSPNVNFYYNVSEQKSSEHKSSPDVNIHYNVSEHPSDTNDSSEQKSVPDVNIISNYNITEQKSVPDVNIISNYNITEQKSVPDVNIHYNVSSENKEFTKGDFIALLGEEETKSLFSVMSSVLLSEDITSIGEGAGRMGNSNVFIGEEAGKIANGTKNTIIGSGAGACSEGGSYNTILGSEAGLNVSGSGNTLLGVVSGASLKEGGWNTFVGQSSGNFVETGSGNVCVGSNSGLSLVVGDGNVIIGEGADVSSSTAENQIVIGKGVMGYGDNTVTFPKNLTPFPSGTEVNFSSTGGGCLYPVSSSLKWKTDIKNLSESLDTSLLYKLRPVSYKTKIGHGDTKATHIGLIAEEVNELFPCVVPKDDNGDPASVRYSLLPVLVIEELKKLKQRIDQIGASKSRKECPLP